MTDGSKQLKELMLTWHDESSIVLLIVKKTTMTPILSGPLGEARGTGLSQGFRSIYWLSSANDVAGPLCAADADSYTNIYASLKALTKIVPSRSNNLDNVINNPYIDTIRHATLQVLDGRGLPICAT